MLQVRALFASILILAAAGSVQAQPETPPDPAITTAPPPPPLPPPPPPAPVKVMALAAPDAFSTPARDTGVGPDLWRGSSLPVVQAVLPLLADRPLTPAAAALARRVLATGAQGPEGAANNPGLVAPRASALMTQGDPRGAAAILARAPGVDRDPAVARVAAEAALLTANDDRACQVEEGLAAGRGDIYWLRLRAYCQAIDGRADEAQLTFDLAQSQARDAVFGRLMGAKLAGAGDPGAASLRNGLDYALSRNLGLDLGEAKPSAAVAAALAPDDPADPQWDLSALAPDLAAAAQAITAGRFSAVDLERLLDATDGHDPKARARLSAAVLLAEPFAEPMGPSLRARIAALAVPEGKASAGRSLALETAMEKGRTGEAALLALWTCAEAGAAGPEPADRARIVRALKHVGLDRDARAFVLEGLLGLK